MPMSSAAQQLLCKWISSVVRYKKNFLSSVGTPGGGMNDISGEAE